MDRSAKVIGVVDRECRLSGREREVKDDGPAKYATDLAAEEDCCTFRTARFLDWRRTPLDLEIKSIVTPSEPNAGRLALQRI